MLDELRLFVIAVEAGSLTATAGRLNTTVATVSRRLTALEEHLGCKLMHRSPRGLILTQEGQVYFNECAEFIHSLDQRLDNLNDTLNSLSGPLRVLAPSNLAVGQLAGFWSTFLDRYPDVELKVEISNEVVDLKLAQADLAVRVGQQQDSSLIQKRLGHVSTVLVAAPELVRDIGVPQHPAELDGYPSVATTILNHWELLSRTGERHTCRLAHKYLVNDISLARILVSAGAGISLLPMSETAAEIDAGRLVRLLPEWEGQRRHFYLVWPYRRALSVRARAFVSELAGFLQAQAWFDGEGGVA